MSSVLKSLLLCLAYLAFSSVALQMADQAIMRRSAPAVDAKVAAIDAEIQGLALDQKAKLWWRVAQEIDKEGGFVQFPSESSERKSLNRWTGVLAADLEAKSLSGQVCGETGDGHFLKGYFATICKSSLVLDKFDPAAQVKLDLSLPPAMAPDEVKKTYGTTDLLVSHQVFEHLLHPTIGIANLNAILKTQGRLIFSTPFIVQDHQSPKDYFRYTVRGIHLLLQCAGFDVRTLRGFGNRVTNIAYISGIESKNMQNADLDEFCDGFITDDCANKYYSWVGAVAIKTKDVTVAEVRDCFG